MIAPSPSLVSQNSLYRIGPIERPVELAVKSDFVRHLQVLTSGWSIAPFGKSSDTPSIVVTHDGSDYIIESDWRDQPARYADDADAFGTFILEMLAAYAEVRPDFFFLHAGAVDIGGRLIVLPATGQGGKSTLVATLAAAGAVVFSDDAFPISLERRTGSAIGISPRPRRPWPLSFNRETIDFLDRHIGLANSDFAYIALPSGNRRGGLAPLETQRPIGAFVIPDRTSDSDTSGKVQLLPASRAETMAQLIGQHLGKQPPARALVEQLAALVGSVPCWRLRYGRADDATKFLIAHPPFAAQ